MTETNAPQAANLSNTKKGLLLLEIYFKAMVFAFTGGLAATPQLIYEITEKHKLMTEDEYYEIVALSNSLPGIIGVNNAYFTGKRIAGNFGALMSISGTVLPAFFSMLIVAVLFKQLPESRVMRGAINGIRAVSIAVLLQTGINIILKNKGSKFAALVVVIALLLPLLTPLSAFMTIILCGVLGILFVLFMPQEAEKQNNNTKKGGKKA